jgi:hypothetical protein
MKKTWGILLGFGLSLATAAFVLTGCPVVVEDDIVVTLSDGTAGDNKVLLTLEGTTWDDDINGVGTWVEWKVTGADSTYVSTANPAAVRVSDTVAEITFSSSKAFNGTVEIEKLYPASFKLYTAADLNDASVDFVSEPVNIVISASDISASDATVALSDGTAGDNKVRLTLTGAKWNNPLASSSLSSTKFTSTMSFSLDPTTSAVSGINGFTAERVSDTEVDVAFWLTASTTTTSYSGKVKVSSIYPTTLRGFTDLASSKSVGVDQTTEVNIVVTSKASGGGGTATEETTAADLVTSLNALVSSTATAAQVSATGSTVTLGDSNITIPSGTTITVPSTVTLVVRDSGAKTLTVNGTLQVKGTVETNGGGLVLSAGGTISGTGTIKHLSTSNNHLLNINSSGTYTIGAVTFEGVSGGIDYGLVNIEGSAGTVNFTGTKFTGHKRTKASGGGLSVGAGTVTLSNCEVSGNTVTASNGGGISISGGTVTLDDCEVSDNLVTGSFAGGGIHISGGTVTLKGTTVSGNDTAGTGGGISINASGAALVIDEKSEITENISTSDGGGVWIGTSGGTVTLKGASVIKKNNGGNRGGGVFLGASGSNLILEGSGTAIYGKFETNGETSQSAALANTAGTAGTALFKNAGSVKVGSTEVAGDVYESDGKAVDTTLLVSNGVLTNRK